MPPVQSSSWAAEVDTEGFVRAEDLPEAADAREAPPAPSKAGTPSHAQHSQKTTSSNRKGTTGFDVAFARRVLASAVARASRCADQDTQGVALVTFAPTGFVSGVRLAGFRGQSDRRGCISRAFLEARLLPFQGDAVTVKRSFKIP